MSAFGGRDDQQVRREGRALNRGYHNITPLVWTDIYSSRRKGNSLEGGLKVLSNFKQLQQLPPCLRPLFTPTSHFLPRARRHTCS